VSGTARVRLAGPGDVPALAGLRRADGASPTAEPDVEPDFERRLAAWAAETAERRQTWVAEVAREPVGMLSVLRFDRMPAPGAPEQTWGYVSSVFVRPEHRGSGIGAALVAAAVQHAQQAGWVRLLLSPSPRSVAVYARAGFGRADGHLVLALGDDERTRAAPRIEAIARARTP